MNSSMVHWETVSCRNKQKELTVSRTQMSDTQNKTNQFELSISSRTLPNLQSVLPRLFTMVIKQSLGGESAGGAISRTIRNPPVVQA